MAWIGTAEYTHNRGPVIAGWTYVSNWDGVVLIPNHAGMGVVSKIMRVELGQ